MSKRSGRQVAVLPITRRQQVAALRTMKANEVAANLAGKIREAVKQEVEKQLATISTTMLDCIDRVLDLEQKTPRSEEALKETMFHCNKCGYYGDSPWHDDCNYYAGSIPVMRKTPERVKFHCTECGYVGLNPGHDCLRKTHEGDNEDRPERTEAAEVPEDDAVVQRSVVEGPDPAGAGGEEGPASG